MIVVVPMAGRGARFQGGADGLPKPLATVAGRPMVAWALESLAGVADARLIFVVLRADEERHGVSEILSRIAGDEAHIVLVPEVTEGQLCTVLAARDFIEPAAPLLIASSDTYVVSDLAGDAARQSPDSAGLISVADLPGDHWSFARADAAGRVVEVAEKVRISNWASTGLYYFARGEAFVSEADGMIRRREKTRGEYYVMPVYQKLLDAGRRVDISVASEMWDMGTPEAKAAFERHMASRRETA